MQIEIIIYWLVLKCVKISPFSKRISILVLVYKFRKIIGKNDFPYHFKKIIIRYKKIGYNINVMRQTACLVVNPIKISSKTPRGKKDSTKRHHHRHHKRQPGDQQVPIQVVTGWSNI